MSDAPGRPTEVARRQWTYSPGFGPTDRAAIPSPHAKQSHKLPSLKDLDLLTPPTSGELPTVDDFAAEHRAHGYYKPQVSDPPLFGPIHDSRQSSVSPRTSAHPQFPSARQGQRYAPASRVLPPPVPSYDVDNAYRNRDEIVWRHKVDTQPEFKRRRLSPPADEHYELAAQVWYDNRPRDRKYGPYAPPTEHHEEQNPRNALASVQPNQQHARPTEYYTSRETAYRPGSGLRFRGSLSESSSVRDRESSIQSHYYDLEDENASIYGSRYQPSRLSGRTLAAKRPRIMESPDAYEAAESHSLPRFSTKGRRNRIEYGAGRSSKMTAPSMSSAMSEAKHSRSRSTKPRKSSNIEDYIDYAPPVSVMINPIQRAKDLKGLSVKNPIDLNNDEYRHNLCDAERIVAQSLNISCKDYTLVKRQILSDYVKILRGKRDGTCKTNWNKTAAQRSSNIDVGKVSQVFTFFQNVGWFDEKHFERFL